MSPPDKGLVLVVDDQPVNVELVEALLEEDGFDVVSAGSGPATLAAVGRRPPDCIVLDVMMPGMDGFTVCRLLKGDPRTRYIPVLMLTALTDVADKVTGLKAGADDFLNKPVDRQELIARVRSLVRIKRLHDDLSSAEDIMTAMTRAQEAKNPGDAGHADRVAAQAVRLGAALGLPAAELHVIGRAGALHDLGKIGVSEHLLGAPATAEADLAELRRHAEIGERILAPLAAFARVRAIVRHHHERLDGSGYPDGIAGDAFDPSTEVVALANHVDHEAQTHPRTMVVAALREQAGRTFRRQTVEALVRLEADGPPDGSWRAHLPPSPPPRGARVVIADDNPANRELLTEMLEEAGHQVLAVENGNALLEEASRETPDLVIADVRMPLLNGFSACRALKSDPKTELVPIILLTAARSADDRREGLAAGADDFLLAPVNRHELVARVSSLHRFQLYYRELEEVQNVILSLATALEAKDPYTHGHSERVGEIAADLSRALGHTPDFCEQMRIAGLLHDIGKIGVPEALLRKPGKLTEDEFRTIMTHPHRGDAICRPLKAITSVLPFIRHHHERYDGKGYPDGLAGDAIPLGARVLSVADAFDALTSDRSYRARMTTAAAIAVLDEETAKGKWEPRIVDALKRLAAEGARWA